MDNWNNYFDIFIDLFLYRILLTVYYHQENAHKIN